MGSIQNEDALYPELYPQIIGSTVFLSDLYEMQVTSLDGEINTTLYDYIADKQSSAWWEYIILLPLKLKAMLLPKKSIVEGGEGEEVSYYTYSEQQFSVLNKLHKKE